jgi:hypothetical protein
MSNRNLKASLKRQCPITIIGHENQVVALFTTI